MLGRLGGGEDGFFDGGRIGEFVADGGEAAGEGGGLGATMMLVLVGYHFATGAGWRTTGVGCASGRVVFVVVVVVSRRAGTSIAAAAANWLFVFVGVVFVIVGENVVVGWRRRASSRRRGGARSAGAT